MTIEATPLSVLTGDLTRVTAPLEINTGAGGDGGTRDAIYLGAGGNATALTKGALKRLVESEAFGKAEGGAVISLGWPTGMAAESLEVVVLDRRVEAEAVRKAGATLGKGLGEKDMLILAGAFRQPAALVEALVLMAYSYVDQKTDDPKTLGAVTVMCSNPESAEAAAAPKLAVAEGVFFTRDLVNAPANVLTTTEFADRLAAMKEIGLEVEVLEEDKLEELGMGALLGVSQGSSQPARFIVMEYMSGAKTDKPTVLVGKGVTFDAGGISLKPGAAMDEMKYDMGGAASVFGAMQAAAEMGLTTNLVGVVAAYLGGRVLDPGADHLSVFLVTVTVAFCCYALAHPQRSI